MRFFPANMDYQKKYFPSSLPSSKLTISLISIYKHNAIDIADPNSTQDGYHELRNRPRSPWSLCGSVVRALRMELEGLSFDSSWNKP